MLLNQQIGCCCSICFLTHHLRNYAHPLCLTQFELCFQLPISRPKWVFYVILQCSTDFPAKIRENSKKSADSVLVWLYSRTWMKESGELGSVKSVRCVFLGQLAATQCRGLISRDVPLLANYPSAHMCPTPGATMACCAAKLWEGIQQSPVAISSSHAAVWEQQVPRTLNHPLGPEHHTLNP